ncbi:SurA N-terminal domain-containing protein [Brevibacterium casei]|uniref:SurA N-terminal domain-containing protein n=1 Tax=Brevibacterium casei TaxID=33889 RepID=A0A7T4A0U1_9MICO|nr:SurA N-terminal domain-containing protein [Brevibacterium casei]QQB15190.1 SurA N-terminal domain-containing protein [Brevibacterium casei]
MVKSKWWVGLAVSVSVVALAGCGTSGDDPSAAPTSPAAEQSDAGAPNTDDIPDVVAEVNGEQITKDEFVPLYETQYGQMMMAAQQGGQPVDEAALKQQTADNLVSTELLRQEADRRGIEVTDDDVATALDETAQASQMSTEEFLSAMNDQGTDEARVNEEMKTQLKIEGLIADEFGEFEVTDEEIGAAYQQAKDQQEQMAAQTGQEAQVPSIDEMRPQLEEQVRSDKANEATQQYAGELQDQGDVTINL